MREAGKILAGIMAELKKAVRPGIRTKELDRLAEGLIFSFGVKSSFRGYGGFPTCLCVSVNEEIVHAAPSERVLKEGDIVSLDSGILSKDFHSDMAITVPVGKISDKAKKLIEITRNSLLIGIEEAKAGNYFGDISRAIQKYVEAGGFNIVRELCGHGIGRELHEDPQILNWVSSDKALVDKVKYAGDAVLKIEEGMVFCIEPMVSAGDWRLKKSPDGFGYQTKDGSLSCHFEHTVVVTSSGAKVLTEL